MQTIPRVPCACAKVVFFICDGSGFVKGREEWNLKKEKLGGYVTLATMEQGNSYYMSGKNLNIICNFPTSIYVNVTYAEFNMMTKPECLDVLGLLVYGRT